MRIIVPASTSNLGAGFDAIGVALALYNTFTFEKKEGGETEIYIDPESAPFVAAGEENLCVKMLRQLARERSLRLGAFRLHMRNGIPFSGGLGSSSTCAVAAVLALEYLCGLTLSLQEKIELCAHLEGHPDNALPALAGGVTVCCTEEGRVSYARFDPPEKLRAALLIPAEARLSTSLARSVLPREVSRADAVFNLTHAALTVAALCQGRLELLREATRDKLHEPYRKPLIPGFDRAEEVARASGALAVTLSGSGAALLALYDDPQFPQRLREKARLLPDVWSPLFPAFDLSGARVEM